MCDYRAESKKAVDALPVPVSQARKVLGNRGHDVLIQAVRDGRAQPARDLYDGHALEPSNLARGYYMSPANFNRMLARMEVEPTRCQWCGGKLSQDLIAQHVRPHNPREAIDHHFHRRCWRARLIAVAVIFGHVDPANVLKGRGARRPRQEAVWSIRKPIDFVVSALVPRSARCHRR